MKILKLIHKLLVVSLIGGVALVIFKPEIIPLPFLHGPITNSREAVKGVIDENVDTKKISQDIYSKGKEALSSVGDGSVFPKNITSQLPDKPEEVVVEDVIEAMGNEIKKLPQQQAERVKYQFCQSVVEATLSGEVAGASN